MPQRPQASPASAWCGPLSLIFHPVPTLSPGHQMPPLGHPRSMFLLIEAEQILPFMGFPCLPESSSHLLLSEKPEGPSCLFQTRMSSCFSAGPRRQAQLLSAARVLNAQEGWVLVVKGWLPTMQLFKSLPFLLLLSLRAKTLVAFQEP